MDSIKVEYFIQEEDGEKYIYMKVLDENWSGVQGANIFSEAGEGLVKSSYTYICFDLSNITFLTSSYLGAIMNLVTLGKENKKNIKFKIHKDCEDIFQVASFNKIATIEVSL